MALNAKYSADFEEFYAAVNAANAGLATWEKGGEAVEKQMDAVAASLTGAPVVSDTAAAADAMGDLGEQAADVPGAVRDIADESEKLPPIFGQVAAAMAGAFTVQQIINFGVGVVKAASEIGDLSVKLGISQEAVQRFTYAAEQGGTTIGTVERAINTMNRALADGSEETVEALNALGLELDAVRDSGSEQAFLDIADAIGQIPDPIDRAKVQYELFGKASTDLTPAIVAGFRDVGAEARIMSEETVRELKEAEAAWGRLGNAVTSISGGIIADGFKAIDSWQGFGIALATAAIPIPGVKEKVTAVVDALRDFDPVAGSASQAASDLGAMVATIPAPTLAVAAALKPVALAAADVDATIAEMNQTFRFSTEVIGLVEPKLGSLEQFTRRAEKATKDVIPATEIWNSGLRFTSEVIGELTPELEQAAAAIESVTAAHNEMTAAVSRNAPGSVGVNLGDLQFGPGGLEAAFKQYSARQGGGAMGGFIGGGPATDFLTWAKSMGLAAPSFPAGGVAGGGAAISNTFNVVDTESEIARRVSEEITRQIQRGSLVQ
jgi:hypothetical protein